MYLCTYVCYELSDVRVFNTVLTEMYPAEMYLLKFT